MERALSEKKISGLKHATGNYGKDKRKDKQRRKIFTTKLALPRTCEVK
jgi:hypothetical protein